MRENAWDQSVKLWRVKEGRVLISRAEDVIFFTFRGCNVEVRGRGHHRKMEGRISVKNTQAGGPLWGRGGFAIVVGKSFLVG